MFHLSGEASSLKLPQALPSQCSSSPLVQVPNAGAEGRRQAWGNLQKKDQLRFLLKGHRVGSDPYSSPYEEIPTFTRAETEPPGIQIFLRSPINTDQQFYVALLEIHTAQPQFTRSLADWRD